MLSVSNAVSQIVLQALLPPLQRVQGTGGIAIRLRCHGWLFSKLTLCCIVHHNAGAPGKLCNRNIFSIHFTREIIKFTQFFAGCPGASISAGAWYRESGCFCPEFFWELFLGAFRRETHQEPWQRESVRMETMAAADCPRAFAVPASHS